MTASDVAELGDLIAGDQIVGAREHQEDHFRIAGFGADHANGCDVLMVLADGMGGQPGGARASQVAVNAFVEAFLRATGAIAVRLRTALDAANSTVGGYAGANPRFAHMGCTLVGCVVTSDAFLHWVSVGDSPLWRVRAAGDGIERLNADHSMRPVLEKLMETGHLTMSEAHDPSAQVLRSALTGDPLTLVDDGAEPICLDIGDRVVLASDGLQTLLSTEILRLARDGARPVDIVSELLFAIEARAKPLQDNATVVVYRHVMAGALRRRLDSAALRLFAREMESERKELP